MKRKNGQIETVGDSYAKVDPQIWKRLEGEEDFSTFTSFV
jgi:hypothetical protein